MLNEIQTFAIKASDKELLEKKSFLENIIEVGCSAAILDLVRNDLYVIQYEINKRIDARNALNSTKGTEMTTITTEVTVKFTVTIPMHDNAGIALDKELRDIKTTILERTGGLSAVAQTGMWLSSNGTLCEESNILLYTYCTPFQAELLRSFVPLWLMHTRQEVLVTTIEAVNVAFFSNDAYAVKE